MPFAFGERRAIWTRNPDPSQAFISPRWGRRGGKARRQPTGSASTSTTWPGGRAFGLATSVTKRPSGRGTIQLALARTIGHRTMDLPEQSSDGLPSSPRLPLSAVFERDADRVFGGGRREPVGVRDRRRRDRIREQRRHVPAEGAPASRVAVFLQHRRFRVREGVEIGADLGDDLAGQLLRIAREARTVVVMRWAAADAPVGAVKGVARIKAYRQGTDSCRRRFGTRRGGG